MHRTAPETPPEHNPKRLQLLLEAIAETAVFQFRPMFGGIIAYVAGRPFASLSNRGLALKLSALDRQRLLDAGGAPLRYEPDDPPSKSYTLVPMAIVDDGDALRPWIACSVSHVSTLPPPRLRAARR